MRRKRCSLGVGSGACGKEPSRHLDHDLFAHVERGNGVVDDLTDKRPASVARENLLVGRLILIVEFADEVDKILFA